MNQVNPPAEGCSWALPTIGRGMGSRMFVETPSAGQGRGLASSAVGHRERSAQLDAGTAVDGETARGIDRDQVGGFEAAAEASAARPTDTDRAQNVLERRRALIQGLGEVDDGGGKGAGERIREVELDGLGRDVDG